MKRPPSGAAFYCGGRAASRSIPRTRHCHVAVTYRGLASPRTQRNFRGDSMSKKLLSTVAASVIAAHVSGFRRLRLGRGRGVGRAASASAPARRTPHRPRPRSSISSSSSTRTYRSTIISRPIPKPPIRRASRHSKPKSGTPTVNNLANAGLLTEQSECHQQGQWQRRRRAVPARPQPSLHRRPKSRLHRRAAGL